MSVIAPALPYIAAAVSAAGAFVQYSAGKIKKKIGDQQAAQKRDDARVLRENAESEIDQQRERVRRFKGTQKVSLLASGVQLEGTAVDLLADTEVQAQLDRDIIRRNADLAARGLEQEARISAFTGSEYGKAGTIKAASTLLASAGKFASR